ncbi:hypothetical protein Bca4012_062324 [Brassica carinata]
MNFHEPPQTPSSCSDLCRLSAMTGPLPYSSATFLSSSSCSYPQQPSSNQAMILLRLPRSQFRRNSPWDFLPPQLISSPCSAPPWMPWSSSESSSP